MSMYLGPVYRYLVLETHEDESTALLRQLADQPRPYNQEPSAAPWGYWHAYGNPTRSLSIEQSHGLIEIQRSGSYLAQYQNLLQNEPVHTLWMVHAEEGPGPRDLALLETLRACGGTCPRMCLVADQRAGEDWLDEVERSARELLCLAGFAGDEAECFRHTTNPDHPEARSRLVEALSRAQPSDTRRDYLRPVVFRLLESEDTITDKPNDAPRVRRLRGTSTQGLLRRGESLELVAGNHSEPVKVRRIERSYGEAEQVYPGDVAWVHLLLPWWANPGEGAALAAPGTLQVARQAEVIAYLLPRAITGRRSLLRGVENTALVVGGAVVGVYPLPSSEWFYEGQERPLPLRLVFSRPIALAVGSRVSLSQDGALLGPGVVTRILASE